MFLSIFREIAPKSWQFLRRFTNLKKSLLQCYHFVKMSMSISFILIFMYMLHSWNSICLITCDRCDTTIVLQPNGRPLGYTRTANFMTNLLYVSFVLMHLYEFQVKKKNWLNNKETILDKFQCHLCGS